RNDGGWMEHFGAEVRQFRGFGEGDDFDAVSAGEDGGVGGEHAIDVGPDLDFFGIDAGADDGGGEIGAAAAERGGDAFNRGTDEAAHYNDALLCERGDGGGEAIVGIGKDGRGLGVAIVGDDDGAGIDVNGGHAVVFEGERDDVAGEALAVAGDGVDGARGELAENGEAFDQFGHLLELVVKDTVELGTLGERHYLAGFAGVEIAEVVELADVFFAIAVDGGLGKGQEFVGGLAHRRDDDDRFTVEAVFDDGGDAFDGGGRFDGGAAEFHDDHFRRSISLIEAPAGGRRADRGVRPPN